MAVRCDVLIIGAGAAGLFCAIQAAKRGRKVIILERAATPGKKILISGGGKCNFTNREVSYKNYLSANPDFCRSALSRYTSANFIAMVEQYGIDYYEKKDGQLFCTDGAKQILNVLLAQCKAYGVEIQTNCHVDTCSQIADGFEVTSFSRTWTAQSLVIATGGASTPKIGATTFGYEIARSFNIPVIEPRPALVPLIWNKKDKQMYSSIAGVSLKATVSTSGRSFTDDILFTHLGLSGPAILQLSSYWKEGESITIDLLSADNGHILPEVTELRPHKTVLSLLSNFLPKRFAELWVDLNNHTGFLDQYSNKNYEELLDSLQDWKLTPETTQGFEKAEVTAGGVDTHALSSKTMEAVTMPGLFFIGEVVDVTGWLGGFNFQWAWSSGWAAGQVA